MYLLLPQLPMNSQNLFEIKIYSSTATGVLITPKHFFFFNIGDSRTLLVRNREVEFASDDHKPTNDGEKRRIENAGGRVMIQRINGSLAVSRALGKPTASLGNLSKIKQADGQAF